MKYRLFDAGLLVIISTMLVLIFTIGLGDSNNSNGTSAYSVFNRGCQQLLGSIDADNFVNQYVGGGLAAAAGAGRQEQNQHGDNDEDVLIENDDDDEPRQQQGTTSRKSGKKARRRNIEQRREMQRQRQLAREYGMMDEAGGLPNEEEQLQAAEWDE